MFEDILSYISLKVVATTCCICLLCGRCPWAQLRSFGQKTFGETKPVNSQVKTVYLQQQYNMFFVAN